MKTIKHLIAGVFLLSAPLAFSQWTQTGADFNGEAADDRSGYSVSLSADATRLAIGAYNNDGNGPNSGHVRIYEWQSGSWAQLGTDINGEFDNDLSGVSVSLNANGSRIAIGATGNDGGGLSSGHVRIYEWQGANWVQVGADLNGEAANDGSGVSVSLSADGNRIAVGAYQNDGNGSNSGQVRLYEWQGAAWVQLGVDLNGEAVDDWFGYSVDLSGNGTRVAIGGIGNDSSGANAGHTRVYEWQGAAWVQLGIDIDGEAANDSFGVSVSLNQDGSRLAIEANGNDGISNGAGHVRIYQWQGAAWTQIGTDINGESSLDASGRSVSLSEDGLRVAIGGPGNNGSFVSDAGHVRIFEWQGAVWVKLGLDLDGEAANDGSGISVSLSADGGVIAVGADLNDGNGASSGHVRSYRFASPNAILGVGSGANSSGEGNIFLGYHSGFNTTDGDNNTFVGESTGHNNTSGSGNVFLGNRVGYNETGSNLLYIDNSNTASPLIWGDFASDALHVNGSLRVTNIPQNDALTRILASDANGNMSWRSDATLGGGVGTFPSYPQSAGDGGNTTNSYFGHQAGLVSTGTDNTFIGNHSGLNTTTGYENSSLGSRTLENNTTGARNTANGVYTLFANTTGSENTAVGYAALGFNQTGSRNTAGGYNSLLVNTLGTENTATGYRAMTNNQTGNFNTGIGGYVMENNISGNNNTALGHRALRYNESGSQNVAVGDNAGPGIGLTNLVNTSAIGYGTTATASNQVRIGNDLVTDIGGYANWSNLSDGRFKKNIAEDIPGLDFIVQLRPVSYDLDRPKLRAFLGKEETAEAEPSEKSIGFVAQEVAALITENGYRFTGVHTPKNEKDHYSIRYAEFVVPLVKGMQEQQELIKALQEKEATRQQHIETLEQKIAALESLVYGKGNVSDLLKTTPTTSNAEGFQLYQNTPNPFNQTTTIKAWFPKNVNQAKIIVYTLNGVELENHTVSGEGEVSVILSGGRLPSGMYLYTLIVDGWVIDTKKMILTK